MDLTNAEFAKVNEAFRKKCEALGWEPTARQASKFRAKRGAVYKGLRRAGGSA